MGVFDHLIQPALRQLNDQARNMGIRLDDANISFQGNTPIVTGKVYSEDDRRRLAEYIQQMGRQMNVSAVEQLTVVQQRQTRQTTTNDDREADREYVVQRGDSFWKIAEQFYGDGTKHKIISEYNRKDGLHPGDVLRIPALRNFIGGEKLQVMLSSLGYNTGSIDGVVGPKTTEALRRFQSDKGLMSTGHLDEHTRSALRQAFYDVRRLEGRALQIILRELGYAVGSVDGVVGPKTTAALRSFQERKGLPAGGSVDERTLGALVEAYV